MTSNVASNGTREGQPRSSYRTFKSFLNETESLILEEATCSKSIVHIDKGGMGGYGYKESLLWFVKGLGPTAKKVAQQKIQECIIPPPNTDFQETYHKARRPQPTTDLNFPGDDVQLESDGGYVAMMVDANKPDAQASNSIQERRPTSSIQEMRQPSLVSLHGESPRASRNYASITFPRAGLLTEGRGANQVLPGFGNYLNRASSSQAVPFLAMSWIRSLHILNC
ncbi:hypothetical protein IFM89_029112 [Coptis chinensis]|uniref:Uncharacterized protein n=1 Tax=Coptis chinensis TaxID=261450 RepID=A0A835H1I0_9MAGN|nr:hypothetical protein IFM89_029112 [Coptis chinensis]